MTSTPPSTPPDSSRIIRPGEALDLRTGLPEDLRLLLARYPREVWPAHANLGQTATFWLSRHNMFRELGQLLAAGTADFREGRVAPDAFAPWFARRMQAFLGQLEEHHHVEDAHYFPLLRAADARLARGFGVLEGDHEAIHHAIVDTAGAANAVLREVAAHLEQHRQKGKGEGEAEGAGEGGAAASDALRHAADAYGDTGGRLLRQLLRHLDDEEDLIIPLILDRSEAGLGMG